MGDRRVGPLLALAAGCLLALPPRAAADERFPRWTKDFTLAGAYSVSYKISGSVEGVTGFHLLPHYGVFVTEWGPRWAPDSLRGSLELLAEPTWLHLDTRESDNHAGLSTLARWVFAGEGRARAYVEAGGGVLVGESGIRQTNCDVLFVLEAGAGVLLFYSDRNAVTLAYRFHHISNGSRCAGNFGLNSAVFSLGLSAFFP